MAVEEDEVVGTLTGGLAAQQRAAAEKAKRKSSSWNAYDFLRLAEPEQDQVYGESVIIRLITDEPDWAEAKQHSFVPTKAAPSDKPDDKKWFTRFGAVCRYTIVPKRRNGEIVKEKWFGDCYICDKVRVPNKKNPDKMEAPFAAGRQWAWAVEREEVKATQEMIDNGLDAEVGDPTYVDVMVDVTINGEEVRMPHYLVLNFGSKNFFDYLLGYNNVYGTVVDRDYKVTRQGKGTETDHNIVALDPVHYLVDGKRKRFDLTKEAFATTYEAPVTLFSLIKDQASEEHYNWFFNKDVESSWTERFGKKEDKAEGESEPAASKGEDSGDDQEKKATLNAMRERMNQQRAKATA